jgi:hypothetical protein
MYIAGNLKHSQIHKLFSINIGEDCLYSWFGYEGCPSQIYEGFCNHLNNFFSDVRYINKQSCR